MNSWKMERRVVFKYTLLVHLVRGLEIRRKLKGEAENGKCSEIFAKCTPSFLSNKTLEMKLGAYSGEHCGPKAISGFYAFLSNSNRTE